MDSGINLADIDNDNDLDLLTGGWWQPVRIYLNNNGSFNTIPEYTSTSTSVVEVITCGDIENDALENIQQVFTSNGSKKLFYFPRTPLQNMKRVIVGSDTLQNNQYCYDLENGWVMLTTQPASGSEVTIETVVSWDIDMGISNWDQNKGNFIFLNTSDPVSADKKENLPEDFVLYQNFPNPFNPSTKISWQSPVSSWQTLKIYDLLGNEVATLIDEYKLAGRYEIEFRPESSIKNLSSGVYFYQLKTGSYIETKKMILMK